MADLDISTANLIENFTDEMYCWILDPANTPQSKRFLLSKIIQNQRLTYAINVGTANAIELVLKSPLTSYVEGLVVYFKCPAANTGAATLKVDALVAKSLVKRDGTALGANELLAGSLNMAQYDGTNFQLLVSISNTVLKSMPAYTIPGNATGAPADATALTKADLQEYFDMLVRGTNESASLILNNGPTQYLLTDGLFRVTFGTFSAQFEINGGDFSFSSDEGAQRKKLVFDTATQQFRAEIRNKSTNALIESIILDANGLRRGVASSGTDALELLDRGSIESIISDGNFVPWDGTFVKEFNLYLQDVVPVGHTRRTQFSVGNGQTVISNQTPTGEVLTILGTDSQCRIRSVHVIEMLKPNNTPNNVVVADPLDDTHATTQGWVHALTGLLANLDTTDKTNLVASINEVLTIANAAASGGSSFPPIAYDASTNVVPSTGNGDLGEILANDKWLVTTAGDIPTLFPYSDVEPGDVIIALIDDATDPATDFCVIDANKVKATTSMMAAFTNDTTYVSPLMFREGFRNLISDALLTILQGTQQSFTTALKTKVDIIDDRGAAVVDYNSVSEADFSVGHFVTASALTADREITSITNANPGEFRQMYIRVPANASGFVLTVNLSGQPVAMTINRPNPESGYIIKLSVSNDGTEKFIVEYLQNLVRPISSVVDLNSTQTIDFSAAKVIKIDSTLTADRVIDTLINANSVFNDVVIDIADPDGFAVSFDPALNVEELGTAPVSGQYTIDLIWLGGNSYRAVYPETQILDSQVELSQANSFSRNLAPTDTSVQQFATKFDEFEAAKQDVEQQYLFPQDAATLEIDFSSEVEVTLNLFNFTQNPVISFSNLPKGESGILVIKPYSSVPTFDTNISGDAFPGAITSGNCVIYKIFTIQEGGSFYHTLIPIASNISLGEAAFVVEEEIKVNLGNDTTSTVPANWNTAQSANADNVGHIMPNLIRFADGLATDVSMTNDTTVAKGNGGFDNGATGGDDDGSITKSFHNFANTTNWAQKIFSGLDQTKLYQVKYLYASSAAETGDFRVVCRDFTAEELDANMQSNATYTIVKNVYPDSNGEISVGFRDGAKLCAIILQRTNKPDVS